MKLFFTPLFFLATILLVACGGSPEENVQEQEQLRKEVQEVVNDNMENMDDEGEEVEPEAVDTDTISGDSLTSEPVQE